MALLTRAYLLLHGIGCLVLGAAGLTDPSALLEQIGLAEPKPTAIAAFRALCGGLLALGLFFFLAVAIKRVQRFGLLSAAVLLLTLIVTQRIGAALSHSSGAMQLVWTAVELTLLVMSVWLYRELGRKQAPRAKET